MSYTRTASRGGRSDEKQTAQSLSVATGRYKTCVRGSLGPNMSTVNLLVSHNLGKIRSSFTTRFSGQCRSCVGADRYN